MEIQITDLTHKGEGVGRADGKATFVPGALPGETVRIAIHQDKKKWQRARLEEIVHRAPEREEPPCPLFGECGGCQMQHWQYEAGLTWKQNRVRTLFAKVGIEANVLPVIGSENPWGYRNAMQLHRKGDAWGFHRAGTHEVIPVRDCPIQSEPSRRLLPLLQETPLPASVHRISVRTNDDEAMLTLHTRTKTTVRIPESIRKAGVRSVWMERNGRYSPIYGSETLPIRLGAVTYAVHPASFFQVNRATAEILFARALEGMGEESRDDWLDLYCGIGALTLQAAPRVKSIHGVDIEPNAIRFAEQTATAHKITNAAFTCAASEKAVYDLLRRTKPVGVFVDPPRAGLDPSVVDRLAQSQAKRIVYISCDPATLARDCARFAEQGWRLGAVQPVDMFPWTTHVECVILMQRSGLEDEK